uniref:Uncharacterized protein n=1 Tax=Heterosigma akashiwo TaxID=2829 RepID=A0A6V2WD90_HETAK|mmetsp:Transcript_4596/g.7404  ORF Transcript_4596/g.7404 Transcript_4596/m.7404 type:complete len:289 (-) Transcript_4596:144-1010(-)
MYERKSGGGETNEVTAGTPGAFLTAQDIRQGRIRGTYPAPTPKQIALQNALAKKLQGRESRSIMSARAGTILSFIWLVVSLLIIGGSIYEYWQPWDTTELRCGTAGGLNSGECILETHVQGLVEEIKFEVDQMSNPALCRIHPRKEMLIYDTEEFSGLGVNMQRQVYWTFCFSLIDVHIDTKQMPFQIRDQDILLPQEEEEESRQTDRRQVKVVSATRFQMPRRKAAEHVQELEALLTAPGGGGGLALRMKAPWKGWAVGTMIFGYASLCFLLFFGDWGQKKRGPKQA